MRNALIASALVFTFALAACGDSASGPVGTWVIDMDHMKGKLKEMGMPEEMLKNMDAGMGVTWEIKSGGTWTAKGKMQGDAIDESGTWKLEGETLTVVKTSDKGKDVNEPLAAEYKGDVIELKPEADMPFSLRMIRK
jgi:hypothetical protein